MSMFKTLKSLFEVKESDVDRSSAAFQSASEAFDRAFSVCEPLGALALSRSSNEADVGDYTIEEVDEHSHAVIDLAEAFAPLIASVTNYHGPESLRSKAEELLAVYGKMVKLAAERLVTAAQCASVTALKGQVNVTQMEFGAFRLRTRLGKDAPPNEMAEVEEMDQSISQISAHFSALEKRAKSAEEQAQRLLDMAERFIRARA